MNWLKESLWYDSPFLDFGKSSISASVWEYCGIYQKINEKLEYKLDIMWRISGKCWYQKRHISGRQFVTFAICDLYDNPDPDIKKSKIRVYLKNGEKLNHLLFMDDLKIFGKSERKVNWLPQYKY